MRTIIFYKSLFGSSKNYAQWLWEELDASVFPFSEFNEEKMKYYDCVVVTSGTYAGKMPLSDFLKNHWRSLNNKKIIALSVGIIPPEDVQSRRSYELIPEYIRKEIKYFKVPGKLLVSGSAGEPSKEFIRPIIMEIFRTTPSH